jgi:hypothetical protein
MKYRTIINGEIKEALFSIKTATLLRGRKKGKQDAHLTYCEIFYVFTTGIRFTCRAEI